MNKAWVYMGAAALLASVVSAHGQPSGKPPAVWTLSAQAPAGLLTSLEAQRHDFFIRNAKTASSCVGAPLAEKCRPGGIDLVFFGSTFTEMWWWPDRGMPVWEQAFASRRAVNFGSQGTRPESLLWRMRNGELDGYQARLVVLQLTEPGSGPAGGPALASYAPVIAEIRARQPQAKILVFAIPRVNQPAPAADAGLADNKTVFYARLSEPLRADRAGYETLDRELEPWLKRLAG
jgi:hypothetical protein